LSLPPRQSPIAYVPVVRGEEPLAQRTLEQVFGRSAGSPSVVVLWIGGARPAAGCPVGSRTIHVKADPRGPLHQTLSAARGCPGHDVLVVRPGCDLPQAWDQRLRVAAYSAANLGCVSPLSLEMLDIRASDEPRRTADTRAVDRYVYSRSRGRIVQIDTCGPLCFYVRHDALAAIAAELDEYAGSGHDFLEFLSRRMLAHGYVQALADHLFVGGRADCHPGPTILRFDAAAASPTRPSHLTPLAQTVCAALSSNAPAPAIPGVDDPPVRLHIINSWGGGVSRWVQDYSLADPQRLNLVLRPVGTSACFAEGLALYRHIDDAEPIRRWRLDPPIDNTAIGHLQYRAILDEILDAYAVGGVIVSSFLGHSLDVLCLDVPTLVVCHDYYPYCAALNNRFGEVCTECDSARLARCLAENRHAFLLRRVAARDWVDLRERFVELVLARKIPLVAPSESVPRGLRKLQPRLNAAAYHVQPHGFDRQAFRWAHTPEAGREKLHAVILGRLTVEKGADLLWDSLAELAPLCDITLLGCGDRGGRFEGRPGIRLVPRYEPEELPRLLDELAPDFGLLLSIVPETFSYTLSELMCAGIPPVVTRLGSFADRVEHNATGFLFDATRTQLVRTVTMLQRNPELLETVRRNLRRVEHVSLAEMLASYDRLTPCSTFCESRYVGARSTPVPELLPVATPVARETFSNVLDRVLSEETFMGLVDRVYEVFRHKLAHSPRLKSWQRPLLHLAVGGGYRVLKWSQRLARYRHRWRKAA
jgi:glycosyltransferase involved in cell wall biosynthesis